MFFNSLLAGYAFDSAETVALWLTVAVVAALVVAGIVIFFAKKEIVGKYAKYATLGFVAYALIVGITMLALQLAKRTSDEYLDDKWLSHDVVGYVIIPLLVLFAVVLAGGIALFVISKFKPDVFKPCAITVGALSAAGLIAAIVTILLYYSNHISEDGYYSEYLNQTALYVSAGVLIALVAVAALVFGRKDKSGFDSRSIALAGVCIAMSFVLSYVKLWEMPQGGSITFVSLLPVMLYAYVYGTKKGVLIGLIYGVMQAMQDPYIIHPAQFILDYPVAFSMVGLAGLFTNVKAIRLPQIRFSIGAVIAASLRFITHVLSGVFAFGADANYYGFDNFWLYSAGYNSFVFVDLALVLVAGIALLSSKAFVRQLESFSLMNKTKSSQSTAERATAEEAAATETADS